MSLILEALRKSEAERRRGQAPDLHSELPPTARLARSRRPAWPWLLALAIIAAAAALATTWLVRGPQAPTPIAVEGVPVEPVPIQSVPDEREPEPLPEQVRSSPQATSTVAPVEPATLPPQVASTTAPIEPTSAPPQRPEPNPSAPPARDINRTRAASVATAPPSTTPPAPSPLTSPTPKLPPAPSPAPAAMPPAPQATATVIDKRAPVHLSDLPAAERRALPPLQISMHMWAPTSAGRFVIIDGARVNEGDRLGDAVVDEITRDGVVLAWRGRRVEVPIH